MFSKYKILYIQKGNNTLEFEITVHASYVQIEYAKSLCNLA